LHWPHEHTLVEDGQNSGRLFICFIDSPEHAHHQRSIHRSCNAFANYVANVESNSSIWEDEKIREVSAYLTKRREPVCDFDGIILKRSGRQEGILDYACFVLLSIATVGTGRRFR